MKKLPPADRNNKVFESRLTHVGWVIVHEGRILGTFPAQNPAEKAAIDLARRASERHLAEVHLFKASGKLRVVRKYAPLLKAEGTQHQSGAR